jgi:hypothetical protein
MCNQLSSRWGDWTKFRPDIAVRQVEMDTDDGPWDSPVAKQFKIRSIPSFQIWGPTGRMLLDGRAAYEDVLKTMEKDTQ